MSDLEDELMLQIQARGMPEPLRQHKFHPSRLWRADFAWPAYRVIAEVQGGTYQHMAHSTGTGIHRDYEKANSAQLMGYIYLQFDREMIEDGSAVDAIRKAIVWEG